MKKVIKALLIVLLVVLAFKFVTSGFLLWAVWGVALPAILRFVSKKIPFAARLGSNIYRYSVIATIGLTILRFFFASSWIMFLIGSLVGIGISYFFLQKPAKN